MWKYTTSVDSVENEIANNDAPIPLSAANCLCSVIRLTDRNMLAVQDSGHGSKSVQFGKVCCGMLNSISLFAK